MKIVLRLGHRHDRDKRISTHCGLVARAFGADAIIYSGEKDKQLLSSVNDVTKAWGGPFRATYQKDWRKTIKKFPGKVVHLTVYGLLLKKTIEKIRKHKNLLIIVGGEKVPAEVYQLADYNVSVTSQPHSEVASLAVFLHEYYKGKERRFKRAKLRVVPQAKGKLVKKR